MLLHLQFSRLDVAWILVYNHKQQPSDASYCKMLYYRHCRKRDMYGPLAQES